MPDACLASKCAGLLPCLLTWEDTIRLKSLAISCIPNTTASTDDGGVDSPLRALRTCKVEFYQLSCWLYSMPKLLVF